METIIKTQTAKAAETRQTNSKSIHPFWEKLEFSRFGIIALLVIIIGCVGGLAASFGAGSSIISLALIAFPTILALAFILAVAPMRVIVYVSAIAILMDLLVLIF